MNKTKKGTLVLVGGAEDKQYSKVVLQTIHNLNNAQNILIIPTASRYGVELGNEYKTIFEQFGAAGISVLDINHRATVDKLENLNALAQADLVFMTGGDQVKLAEIFNRTAFLRLLKERHQNENLNIAGTSAGAAVTSTILIYDGDDFGFYKGSVKDDTGFGLMPLATVDTHFMERNRIPRLVQFLASGKSKRGIGISEDTAAFVFPNNTIQIVGSGVVVLIDATNMDYTNYHEITDNQYIATSGIKISFLVHGSKFDLTKWKVLP